MGKKKKKQQQHTIKNIKHAHVEKSASFLCQALLESEEMNVRTGWQAWE